MAIPHKKTTAAQTFKFHIFERSRDDAKPRYEKRDVSSYGASTHAQPRLREAYFLTRTRGLLQEVGVCGYCLRVLPLVLIDHSGVEPDSYAGAYRHGDGGSRLRTRHSGSVGFSAENLAARGLHKLIRRIWPSLVAAARDCEIYARVLLRAQCLVVADV